MNVFVGSVVPVFQNSCVTLDEAAALARACTLCAAHLPLGPRPVLRVSETARLLIIGQAPGTRVHETGIPWNDASGTRLRAWLGMGTAAFVAFLMSLCNQRFTATQYALLSAFASVGRVWVGPLAGVMVESIGWPSFFVVSTVLAIPALLMLWWLRAAVVELEVDPDTPTADD